MKRKKWTCDVDKTFIGLNKEFLVRRNSNFLIALIFLLIPIELSSQRYSIDPESVMLSGYIWQEFVALHHHVLEISCQAPLKLLYFKGLDKENG